MACFVTLVTSNDFVVGAKILAFSLREVVIFDKMQCFISCLGEFHVST